MEDCDLYQKNLFSTLAQGSWVDEYGTLSYFNWYGSEPDNAAGIQDCIFTNFQAEGEWGDNQCDGTGGDQPCYACQTPLPTPPPTTKTPGWLHSISLINMFNGTLNIPFLLILVGDV